MAFKDIMVFIDDGKANYERVKSSLYLAKLHDAHLTAVALGSMKPIYAPKLDSEATERMAKRSAEHLLAEVVEVAKESGVTVDPLIIYGDTTESAELMAQHARNQDLVMLAQPNPSRNNFHWLRTFAEDVLVHSGRPILFMPYVGMRNTAISEVMNKVMIAWDGTPSSCRALHDAMPILSHAKKVIIMLIENKKLKSNKTCDLAEDLNKHLSRHGVNSSVLCVKPDGNDTATIIMNKITDHGVDLLVMGGYGTPKLHQKIFGGVSSTLLSSMPIPVLMSH